MATAGWAPDVLRDVGEDASDVYVVGLRESDHPEAWSLLFIEHDGESTDSDLGMDTYCLVVEPGQATYYGGVRGCRLSDGQLRLVLTEGAAIALGMPAETTFQLELATDQLKMLRRGLFRTLTSGDPLSVPSDLSIEA